MKDILIVLLVVVLLILTLGAVNHGVKVDLDYVFGTWHQVSLLWLSVIVLALVAAVGVLGAGYIGVRAGGERQKLEKELEQTYVRLRAAEAQARPAVEERGAEASAIATPSGDEAEAAAGPSGDEAETAGAEPPADEAGTGATPPAAES